MKAITGIGIGVSIVALLLAVIMEGGNPMALMNIPALIIIVGGTLGASMSSSSMEQMKAVPKLYARAMKGSSLEPKAAIQQMVGFAEKARREGLLALEKDMGEIEDTYTRKGMQLIVDGTDSDLVRDILQSEVDSMATRHHANYNFFMTAGGFAPTIGVLGTVLSLVHVLENLSDPASLGHSIAGAFLATLYGVGSANIIYIPVSNKLKELSAEEVNYRQMLMEAILSIQAGDNPRMLAEKLETFLPPTERGSIEEGAGTGAGAAAGGEQKQAA